MIPEPRHANPPGGCRQHLIVGLSALALTLAAAGASSQTQPVPTPAPPPVKRPVAPVPPARVPAPAPGQRPANQPNNLLNLFQPAAGAKPAAGEAAAPSNPLPNAAAGRTPANATGASSNAANRLHLANLNQGSPSSAHLVQSRMFPGYPAPPGSKETQTRSGNIVRTDADGNVLDVRSVRNGMVIHHGLDGSRQVMVERPDRSRVFAPSHGLQYVQHPYVFRGHAYDHRTFVAQGNAFHEFYRPYRYGATNLDVYAPSRYYAPGLYQWATTPFNKPQGYNWPYAANTPWFAYYRGYFTPQPSYSSPQMWLADYVLAASLFVSYKTAAAGSQTAPPDAAATVTPEVKQKVADEVDRQVKEESVEAQQNAQNKDPPPGAGGVVQELTDGQTHAFVVSSDLDLVDPSGRRCMISEGDVVEVVSQAKPDSTVDAVVLSSKGGLECERAAQVQIALNDVQEMQNHMRETVDQGIANTNAGKQAPKVTPAFAAAAPPADANAAQEIAQQQQIAAAAEG
jgi:hypothetical protein